MPGQFAANAPRVLLFDIDGTLLLSGGAGSGAMKMAFKELFGAADGFSQISFSGRTDTAIFRDALRLHNLDSSSSELFRSLKRRYLELLPTTLSEYQGELMPGVSGMLAALSQRDDVVLGLATGNFRDGAYLKLRHYGIASYFAEGGFGDDVEQRAELVSQAIQRVANGSRQQDIFVIGDTPLDVQAALDNGVVPVAVATGMYSAEELTAAGASFVFTSFAEWEDALSRMLTV